MLSVDLLGYLAGMFLLMMAAMKNQTHMRICNVMGNLCFIAYGLLAGIMPVLILNIIVMGLHIYRMLQSRKASALEAKVTVSDFLPIKQQNAGVFSAQ